VVERSLQRGVAKRVLVVIGTLLGSLHGHYSRWCHAACFGLVEGGDVPEEWRSWVCGGEIIPDEEQERAVMMQRKRLGATRVRNTGTSSATGGMGTNAEVSSQRQGQRKGRGRRGGCTGEWGEWGRAGCGGWEGKMGTVWVLAECGCEAGDMSGCAKTEEKGRDRER